MIYIVSVNNFIYACSNFQVFFKANNSVPHWNTNFQVVYIKQCTYIHACLVTQLYLTLCNPLDCRRPDSSVYGIFQARILKGVASSFSRDLPDPGIKPASPVAPALAGGFFTTEPPGKPNIQSWYVVKRVGLKPQCLGPNCGPITQQQCDH